ncbi:glycosyltransferase [Salmonirosea aquatica]|uniref:Glycosyltransferase n=1 Tax=Salmonirosea aquatica TaxID=2654236 RepID=A0A7C9BDC2_9BACT|nr:glycosyltransferase [Cytophagaceae bacterium SJW1-29]
MKMPLVSVICTTYNHEDFVDAALASVARQTYPNIELIIIDNASTDSTLSRVDLFCQQNPHAQRIANAWNKGLCSAFNQGLALAQGKYVIDFSGDDILIPSRIERQVAFFENLPEDYGVIFSNALYIDATGAPGRFHYPVDATGRVQIQIPTGDVYKDVLERYFICTPTMMMRRSVIEALGGYDESLTYEDFDFWVRSSVRYMYAYQDEVLTHKRVLPESLSGKVYQPRSGMLQSTFSVCNKAYDLNRSQEEFDALALRIRTFIRKCFYAQEFELAIRFRHLLNYIEDPGLPTELIVFLCRLRLPVNWAYRFYAQRWSKKLTGRRGFDVKFVTNS